jgi:hypothetical protein
MPKGYFWHLTLTWLESYMSMGGWALESGDIAPRDEVFRGKGYVGGVLLLWHLSAKIATPNPWAHRLCHLIHLEIGTVMAAPRQK